MTRNRRPALAMLVAAASSLVLAAACTPVPKVSSVQVTYYYLPG
jgi:hypothetical protein